MSEVLIAVDKDEIMKAWLARPDHTIWESNDFCLGDALDRLQVAPALSIKEAQITDGARIYQAAKQMDEEKRAKDGEMGSLGRKRRIAFVAYNADMWDALATIHAEALKDPEAEVSTIVVPWYERDENRQPTVKHDESNKFPADVELTAWEKYD